MVKPGGILLIFDAASPPTLFDGTSPTGTQAWTDAFHRSLSYAGLSPFAVDQVVKVFRNEELQGSDMRVPIGHGQGESDLAPSNLTARQDGTAGKNTRREYESVLGGWPIRHDAAWRVYRRRGGRPE